jgi:hypothetical protein
MLMEKQGKKRQVLKKKKDNEVGERITGVLINPSGNCIPFH